MAKTSDARLRIYRRYVRDCLFMWRQTRCEYWLSLLAGWRHARDVRERELTGTSA